MHPNARVVLQGFPKAVRSEAGEQLFLVQAGEDPDDWKPMSAIGPGVKEIRVRDEAGAFRVFYVAKFQEAVYVLHCFQKKTQKTEVRDLELGRKRFKDLLEDRRK